jgi:hypothetical protein
MYLNNAIALYFLCLLGVEMFFAAKSTKKYLCNTAAIAAIAAISLCFSLR